MNEITCPIPTCDESYHPLELKEHLETAHNIGTKNVPEEELKDIGLEGTYRRLSTYTWGTPLNVKDKSQVREEEAEQTYPRYGEVVKIGLDETGKRVYIDKPKEVADELKKELRNQGLEPKYIKIQGAEVRCQYVNPEGETLGAIAIAIAAIAVATAIVAVYYLVVEKFAETLYEIIKEALPEWAEGPATALMVAGAGLFGGYLVVRILR